MIQLKNYSRHPLNLHVNAIDALHKFPCLLLAGGAIRDGLKGRDIVDYDFFFSDLNYKDRVKEYFISKGFILTFACPEGKLYSLKKSVGKEEDKLYVKVQLICKRAYRDVQDLLESFDFSICQFAISDKGIITTTKQAIYDNKKMFLRLVNLTYPTATINRISKYKQKGYWTGDAIKQIVKALVDLDPTQYNAEDDALYID